MVELLLILFGGHEVRRRWWLIGFVGLIWGGLGVFFFVNALIDEVRIHPMYFAIPLAIEGALSLIAALGSAGGMRLLRLGQSIGLLALALLIALYPFHGGMLIGFLVGGTLIIEQVCELLGVEEGSLLLADDATGDLIFAYTTGPFGSRLLGQRLPRGVGLAGYVATNGVSLIVNDAQNDNRFYAATDRSTGFTMCTFRPTCDERLRSSSCPQPVTAIRNIDAPHGLLRMRCATS